MKYFLAAVAATVPAMAYLMLLYFMPSQYRYILGETTGRFWPLLLSTAVLVVYAGCIFWIYRRHIMLSLATACLASTPVAASLFSFWVVTTITSALALTSIGAFLLLAGLYRWLTKVRVGPVSVPLGGALAVFIAFALAHAVSPIEIAREIGAFAIFAVFVGMIGVLLVGALLRPWYGAFGIFYCVLAVSFLGSNNHAVPILEASGAASDVQSALSNWLQSRKDLSAYRDAQLPYPVIFVSAEGGGIYAAAHAYETLSILSQRCPTFSQHVFTAVGVSGGALGNALFATNVDPVQKTYAPCKAGNISVDASALAADHFSPVLARLLLLEVVDRLLPGQWLEKDRASILADSFLSVSNNRDYLKNSVSMSWDYQSARPALVAVATNVSDGNRFIMSPLFPSWGSGTAEWWPGGSRASDFETTVIEAATISARFPWITPTARLTIRKAEPLLAGKIRKAESRLLADGGYFENSGADTVLDLIHEVRTIAAIQNQDAKRGYENVGIKCRLYVQRNFRQKVSWKGCEMHVFLIHLAVTSTPSTSAQSLAEAKEPEQSFLLDPITTFLNTRSARGGLALQRAGNEQCGSFGAECVDHVESSIGFFRSEISASEMELPLGWHIPLDKVDLIGQRAIPEQAFKYKECVKENKNYEKCLEDNDNDIAKLIHHLDTSLFAPGARPSVEELLGGP